jgi:hypothetical protein
VEAGGVAEVAVEASLPPQAVAAKVQIPHSNTFRLDILFNMIVSFLH